MFGLDDADLHQIWAKQLLMAFNTQKIQNAYELHWNDLATATDRMWVIHPEVLLTCTVLCKSIQPLGVFSFLGITTWNLNIYDFFCGSVSFDL